MREKLGVAGVLALTLAIWLGAFWWQRGVDQDASRAASATASPSSSTSPTVSSAPSPSAPASSSRPQRQLAPKIDQDLLADLRDGTALAPEVDAVVASLNLLGSDHTAPGGNYPGYASGVARLAMALQLLDREQVTLVGLQEVQGDQAAALAAAPGWQMYPERGGVGAAGQNAVMWRSAQWELVRPGSAAIPYFGGAVKQMPVVLLRHRESGLLTYLSTFHNPASTKRVGQQRRWRVEAAKRQVALVDRIRATGVPHLMTGDFNERESYFCTLAGATGFTSPAGGSHDGGCRPPADLRIDQVFGDPEVTWTGYAAVRDDLVRRATDHHLVVAGVRIDAADFPEAWQPVGR